VHAVSGVSSHPYVVNSWASHQIGGMWRYEFERWGSIGIIERFWLIIVSSLMQVNHVGSRILENFGVWRRRFYSLVVVASDEFRSMNGHANFVGTPTGKP